MSGMNEHIIDPAADRHREVMNVQAANRKTLAQINSRLDSVLDAIAEQNNRIEALEKSQST